MGTRRCTGVRLSTLSHNEVWTSKLSYEEFIDSVYAVTDPVDQFQLIFKLSDGGIVTRSIRPPKGECPFFGRFEASSQKFQAYVVQRRGNENITAYQPICRLLVSKQDETRVELEWAPHGDIDRFNSIYLVGSIVCLIAGLVGIQANPLAWIAVLLSPIVWLFPSWRGKSAFAAELGQARAALAALDCWIESK